MCQMKFVRGNQVRGKLLNLLLLRLKMKNALKSRKKEAEQERKKWIESWVESDILTLKLVAYVKQTLLNLPRSRTDDRKEAD